jgi:hypothetical protein
MNEIDASLREFILSHAPQPIVKCGDIVTTNWGWKKPHKARIYTIAAEIVNLNLTIRERELLGIKNWIGVECDYFANRINDKGEPTGAQGMVLTNFTTEDGREWKKIGHTFNHAGLMVILETLK